jgi:FHS family L-fucose permease-like MFS transporter
MMGNAAQKSISDANPLLFLAMGIFALVFIVLYFVQIPEPHIVKKEEKVKNKHSALSFRHFVLGIVTIFIYVGIEVGVPNIANLFMTEIPDNGGLGMDPTIAGTIVGTYWFLMLIGRLVGGALGKMFSSKQMLTFVSSTGLILTLAAIYAPIDITVHMPVVTSQLAFEFAEVPINVMFLILIGLCTSIMWPGIFNLATMGIGKYMAQGSGIFMTMVVGGGILPLVQGGIADIAGYLNSYWLIVASLAFMLYYALIGSKNINTDIPVD